VPNAGGVVTWLRQLGVLADGAWPAIRDGAVLTGAGRDGTGRDGTGRDGGGGGPATDDGALRGAGGLWCVPAIFGLGTPSWDPAARADIIGLNAASTAADIAEAALLGVVHQVADAVDAVRDGLAGPLELVRVDGGLGRNDSVLQAIADLAAIALERPARDGGDGARGGRAGRIGHWAVGPGRAGAAAV